MPQGNSTFQLQNALRMLGFPPGPVDGIPGAKTTQAIKTYQASRGLKIDGVVGPKTLAQLRRDGFSITEEIGSDKGWAVHAKPESVKPWLDYAFSNEGVAEIPGPRHSTTIMGWIRDLGARRLGIEVKDDESAWCGTFVGICILRGLPGEPLPAILVRAKAWEDFGVELKNRSLGAIMVFDRPGGGHVGFYLGEDPDFYHIIGGNQGNRVSRMRLEKSRLTACRWPSTVPFPTTGPIAMTPKGEISRREA